MTAATVQGVELRAAAAPRSAEILTPPALAFLADLHRRFDGRRRELLARRAERQNALRRRRAARFLTETRAIREGDWKVAPIPADLLDRRVEITGPVDRKMIVNALNSGAKVFMARFRGRLVAGLRQHDRGPGQPQGPLGRAHRLHRSRRAASATRSSPIPPR